jgi:predicted Zn-dependent protease
MTLRCTQEVLKHSPEAVPALQLQLEALIGLRRTDAAFTLSTRLVQKGCTGDKILMLRAECLYQKNELAAAEKHAKLLLRSDPDMRSAQQLLKRVRKLLVRYFCCCARR